MELVRALPTNQLMPAASSRNSPVATSPYRWTSRKERAAAPIAGNTPYAITSPGTPPRPEHPDKAGRRHAPHTYDRCHDRPQETDMTAP
jgi:hypothetical protein